MMDLRGYGDSVRAPADTEHNNYAKRNMALDAIAVMNHLGFDGQFDVVGHDWGAVIAWGVALYHPDRVRRLVAVSVGHPQAYGRSGPRQKFGKGFYTVWFQLRGIAEWYLLSGGGFSRWLKGHPDPDEVMARMQDRARLKAGLSWYRANLISALISQYPRCTVPTLGIWSDGDNFLEESQMLDSARYVDAPWQYHRVDGCGHWIPLEKAEDLAETILQWIEQPTLK